MDVGMKDVIDVARKATEHAIVTVPRGGVDEAKLVALPEGVQLHDVRKFLDAYREAPERREGVAVVTDRNSFVEHVNRFKDADSVLFAVDDPKNPSLQAVIDYHRAGHENSPRFGLHRTMYRFPISDEWRFWMSLVTADGPKMLDQSDFARLLEDRIMDVMDPGSVGSGTTELLTELDIRCAGRSKLRELSRGLDVRIDSRVAGRVNLNSGESKLTYSEEHQDEAGQPLIVPSGFVIGIPVFREGVQYQIAVRLRYRPMGGGKVKWSLEPHRPDAAFRDAFLEACRAAAAATGLPLLFGAPEAKTL